MFVGEGAMRRPYSGATVPSIAVKSPIKCRDLSLLLDESGSEVFDLDAVALRLLAHLPTKGGYDTGFARH